MIKTKQELLNHFSDINEMYNNPFMYQTLSNMIDELLEQQPCTPDCKVAEAFFKQSLQTDGDCIRREEVIRIAEQGQIQGFEWQIRKLCTLPSVTPKFTDEEIQKMQELEQVQLEKAYELGKTEMQTSFEEWLSSFNTESATCCFTAVQELKKRLEGDDDRN